MGNEGKYTDGKPDQPQNVYGQLSEDAQVKMKTLALEAGWLGIVFGTAKNAPTNVAALVLVFFLLIGCIMAGFKGFTDAVEFWKFVTPLLTLILGYMLKR